jgi:hypothetical protein
MLAEVVSVVVDEKDGFGSQGLVIGVPEGGEEIRFLERGDEFLAIGPEGGERVVPSSRVGWFGRFQPVAIRKVGRFVFRVKGVFDNVPLRDAKMFDELKSRVGKTVNEFATKIGRKVFDRGAERCMGIVFVEKENELFAEGG